MAVSEQIQQAIEILKAVGMPMERHAEMRANVFLALLGIDPKMSFADATDPLIGITPIIEFCNQHYREKGDEYQPNTRETIRDEGVHYFVEAGMVVPNPDKPSRPKNSPAYAYQVDPALLELVKLYGTSTWKESLKEYLDLRPSLKEKYAREREQVMVPVQVKTDKEIKLSAGSHSELIKAIIEDFAPRHAGGSHLVYVGDTGDKWGYFDEDIAKQLKLVVGKGSKMPDVILFDEKKNWLFLIESVTSNGPVDGKRFDELKRLFGTLGPGLIYVTAFPSRQAMTKFLVDLMWDTEVWVASDPSHLIHFNGDRFLGPR